MKKKILVSLIQIIIVIILAFSYNFVRDLEVTKMDSKGIEVYRIVFTSMLSFLIIFQNIFFSKNQKYNLLFMSTILISNYFIFNKNFSQAPILSMILIVSSILGLYSNIWINKLIEK